MIVTRNAEVFYTTKSEPRDLLPSCQRRGARRAGGGRRLGSWKMRFGRGQNRERGVGITDTVSHGGGKRPACYINVVIENLSETSKICDYQQYERPSFT